MQISNIVSGFLGINPKKKTTNYNSGLIGGSSIALNPSFSSVPASSSPVTWPSAGPQSKATPDQLSGATNKSIAERLATNPVGYSASTIPIAPSSALISLATAPKLTMSPQAPVQTQNTYAPQQNQTYTPPVNQNYNYNSPAQGMNTNNQQIIDATKIGGISYAPTSNTPPQQDIFSGLVGRIANPQANQDYILGQQATRDAMIKALEAAPRNNETIQQQQSAITNLMKDYAKQSSNIELGRTNLQQAQGEQGALNRLYTSNLGALQTGLSNVLTANEQNRLAAGLAGDLGQGIAGLGQSQQSLQQQGMLGAAGLAQPQLGQYGQTYYSPLGGGAGDQGGLGSTINFWAQQIANNQASVDDVPDTIKGNVQLRTQLQQAIQGYNPNYNPSVQAAQQQSAAELSQQASSIQALLNGADQNFNLLLSIAKQGNVLDSSTPMINQLTQSVKRGLASDASVVMFQSLLNDVRAQYASVFGGGTPTDTSRNQAIQAIPDNVSLNALMGVQQALTAAGQNRIAGFTNQSSSQTQSQQYEPNDYSGKPNPWH